MPTRRIAIKPDDALANYAEAVAYTGMYYTGGKKDADKASANSYAGKASNMPGPPGTRRSH